MAIDKEALQKRYAKNRFERLRKNQRNAIKSANNIVKSDGSSESQKTTNSDDISKKVITKTAKAGYKTAKKTVGAGKEIVKLFVTGGASGATSSSSVSAESQNGGSADPSVSNNSNSFTKPVKKANKQLAKKTFKNSSTSNKELDKSKKAAQKLAKKVVKKITSNKILMVLLLFVLIILISIFSLFPIVLSIFDAESEISNNVTACYPADENDITRVNVQWQLLTSSIKETHSNLPNTITEHFDKKKSETAEIMDDNNKLLSLISAYYGEWTFEEVEDFVNTIFREMYVIEYSLESKSKVETGKTMVTLNYKIVEKMSWEDILDKYLVTQEQKDAYTNYYENQGGAIKAFSSPFAFDWSNLITSTFGYRVWDDGSTEFHKGLDFGVANGTEILAIADGKVEVGTGCIHNYPKDGSCGCNGGFGNYVEIQTDNGCTILYGHMSQVAVRNGQTVKNGQVIGYSGCTGWSTGFHLHLQIVKDGEYIDPMVFIKPYVDIKKEV